MKKRDIYATIGASNHSKQTRAELDYYATPPAAVDALLNKEQFNNKIWECCCGGGHISEALKLYGYEVKSTDLINRGYTDQEEEKDFLYFPEPTDRDIITNPPYNMAADFARVANEIIQPGAKIAMLLKLTFLESESRRELFQKYPPKKIYVFTSRINCALNGNADDFRKSSAVCYAWFIWEYGNKENPVIYWL